ncbi:hypothetical protein GCM10028805_64110 [Spirosoma harenae]
MGVGSIGPNCSKRVFARCVDVAGACDQASFVEKAKPTASKIIFRILLVSVVDKEGKIKKKVTIGSGVTQL